VVVAAALGLAVVSALWWLDFDVAAILARRRLMQARSLELHRLSLHSYSYLHLPLAPASSSSTFGLETTLHHVGAALETVPAVALCGGAALYLLGHIAFLFRTTGHVFRRRTVGRSRCSPCSRLRSRSRRSRTGNKLCSFAGCFQRERRDSNPRPPA
jgi:low temperature requirement protein LtrA